MEIIIDSLRVHYEKIGNGSPVLLLPGWGMPVSGYKILTQALSQKYTVFSLDLPGFGVTQEPSEPWSVKDYTDFVTEFIKLMKLSDFVLIGHSFGGRIILKLFESKSDLPIKKIVFIDAAGIRHELNDKAKSRQKKFKKLKKIYGSKCFKLLFPNSLERLQNKYGSDDYRHASPVMKQCLVKAISEDLSNCISNIKCPALLIWGKDDTATPVSDAEKIHSIIPDSELFIIDNAGHFPFIDQPFEFLKIIQKI